MTTMLDLITHITWTIRLQYPNTFSSLSSGLPMRYQKISSDVDFILWAQNGFGGIRPTLRRAGLDKVLERDRIFP